MRPKKTTKKNDTVFLIRKFVLTVRLSVCQVFLQSLRKEDWCFYCWAGKTGSIFASDLFLTAAEKLDSVDDTDGGAENDGHENDGPSKCRGMKLTDMKLTDMKLTDMKMQDMFQVSE